MQSTPVVAIKPGGRGIAVLLLATGLTIAASAPLAAQQTTIEACYVARTGVLYLIDPSGESELRADCSSPNHQRLSFVDGAGADHGGLSGLGDDDHSQYVPADGSRPLTGALDADGNKLTALAAATESGDAVRYDEAVLDGDAAGGDLGGTYPDPTVGGLQGRPVSNSAPTENQMLGWDGSSWVPMNAEMVIDDHGNLTGLSDDDHTQYLKSNGTRVSEGFAVTGSFGSGTLPVSGSQVSLIWHPAKAAFRAGHSLGAWEDADIGNYSVAMGAGPTASGARSTALGNQTTASGGSSTALGALTEASGVNSTAMGNQSRATGGASTAMGARTEASGGASTALGENTVASGDWSLAVGNGTTASGTRSVAIGARTSAEGINSFAGGGNSTAAGNGSLAFGSRVATRGQNDIALGANAGAPFGGSFVFGDGASGSTRVTPIQANQFYVRASGGTRFYSSANLSTGVALVPGSGAWASLSDRDSKVNFHFEDGEAVLAGIAGIPVTSWNYRAQDPSIRHIGPMAQDFHATFGLGGDERTITTVDIDGVNMLGIQALEKRTRDLATENEELRERLNELEAMILSLLNERR